MNSDSAPATAAQPEKEGSAEWDPQVAREDGVRLNKWDLRKIRTRRTILRAGRELFAAEGFVAPRVEDVARAAGVSRAAFYLHFTSLEDLIQQVFLREVRWQLRRYRGLTDEILTSRRRIRGWLERFFASFRQERRYILIVYRAYSNDPANMRVVFDEHLRVIERLALRVSRLRLSSEDGTTDPMRSMQMHTLMRRIDEMSAYSAFNAWSEQFEPALDMLVDDIAHFSGLSPES